MTTKDVVSTHASASVNKRRGVKAAAVTIAAAFTLAACGAPADHYVDGWWDNGDPIYAPEKQLLFDEDGEATCDFPTVARQFESRARSFAETGGLVNLFLFEILNEELDPAAISRDDFESNQDYNRERRNRERGQDSLGTIYQMTHPDFDANNGISGPEDLAAIKEELRNHLDGLERPVTQFIFTGDRWLETPHGRYTVRRVSFVEGFIEDNNIPHRFQGLANEYASAQLPTGEMYLMITERETGTTVLLSEDEEIELGEESELFIQFKIDLSDFPAQANDPHAIITLANDQCPAVDDQAAARYWIYDYELFFPVEREPIEIT